MTSTIDSAGVSGDLPSAVPTALQDTLLRLYSAELPYHNAGHALDVRAEALRLSQTALRAGLSVDVEVVELAALGHDAGYREVAAAARESHAAALTARLLRQSGYDSAVVDHVTECIMATEHKARPDSVEARIVRASDLSQLAGAYPLFSRNSARLRVEHDLLTGATVSDHDWRQIVSKVVGGYLASEDWLRGDLVIGGDRWHHQTQDNLNRYLSIGS